MDRFSPHGLPATERAQMVSRKPTERRCQSMCTAVIVTTMLRCAAHAASGSGSDKSSKACHGGAGSDWEVRQATAGPWGAGQALQIIDLFVQKHGKAGREGMDGRLT